MNSAGNDRLVALRDRVQNEFQEFPGLHLTRWQAARLWGLDPAECEYLMKGLVAAKVLRETRDGYVAGDRCIASPPRVVQHLRSAKA